jgi:hypothetical protein
MRAGLLSGGLLITGDAQVEQILLCRDRPTRTLFHRVIKHFTSHLATVSAEVTYDVDQMVEDAKFVVTRKTEPIVGCVVTLTSPAMCDDEKTEDEGEMKSVAASHNTDECLNKQKCLDALSALRRAKWFQIRVSGLRWGVLVVRILRNLSIRVPTWNSLSDWGGRGC